MKKYLIALSIFIIVLFSSRYFIFTKHIEKKYPMSYVYHVPIEKVRKNIINMFSNSKFNNFSFEVGYDSLEIEMLKLSKKENKNHFFVNWFGWDSNGKKSKIYYNFWGKLKLIPSYHIVLDSLSINQTKINILSFPQVEAGLDFSINHMLPSVTSRKVTVKPSTIEEYQIIKTIGEKCGEKKMPTINEY